MLIVVGGHSRNIGKTSVAAAIIAESPHRNWTAVKITQFGHGLCSAEGAACDCAPAAGQTVAHPYALSEEHDAASGTDSARFLNAGAKRAYWLRTAIGDLGHALPALRRIRADAENVIVESNSVLQFLEADLYLCVADFSNPDFKPTSLRYLDRADALVVTGGDPAHPAWPEVSRSLWSNKPQFAVLAPRWMSAGLRAFLTKKTALSLA